MKWAVLYGSHHNLLGWVMAANCQEALHLAYEKYPVFEGMLVVERWHREKKRGDRL